MAGQGGVRRSARRFVALVSTLALTGVMTVTLSSISAVPVAAAPSSAAFLDGEPGEYIGQGQQLSFGTVVSNGSTTFTLTTTGHSFTVKFAPPNGAELGVGAYENSRRNADASHPGLDVAGDGRSCFNEAGRFFIDEIVSASGVVSAFYARFEIHCDGAKPALFGVVAYNASTAFRTRSVAPESIQFGSVNIGSTSTARTITITNGGPGTLTISNASVVGVDSPDFPLAQPSSCLAAVLQSGQSCSFSIRFAPKLNTGSRSVWLQFHDDLVPPGGRGRRINLTGTAAGTPSGYARPGPAFFDSELTEGIGGGHTTQFRDAYYDQGASPNAWRFKLITAEGAEYHAWFAPPQGQVMAVGTYEDAQRALTRDPSHPGLDVSGGGWACNAINGRFIVDAVEVDESGVPTVFSARFEQHCSPGGPALFGTVTLTEPYWGRELSASSLHFGYPEIGQPSAPQEIVVTNTGAVPLAMDSAEIVGADAADFRLGRTSSCLGATLAPGQSCKFRMVFTPSWYDEENPERAYLRFFDDLAPVGGAGRHILLTGLASDQGNLPAWQNLGGYLISNPTHAFDDDFSYVFALGSNHAVFYRRYDGVDWGPWTSLGGYLTSEVEAVSDGTTISIFARGSNGAIFWRQHTGSTWTPWKSLGGYLTTEPSAVLTDDGIALFARGSGYAVYWKRYDGSAWTSWQRLDGAVVSLTAIADDVGNIALFGRGTNNSFYWRIFDGDSWTSWTWLGANNTADPVVVFDDIGLLLFSRARNGAAIVREYDAWNHSWSSWYYLAGNIIGSVGAVDYGFGTLVTARGVNNTLYYNDFDFNTWSGWFGLGGSVASRPEPALDWYTFSVFAVATNRQMRWLPLA